MVTPASSFTEEFLVDNTINIYDNFINKVFIEMFKMQ